ncbi:TFIIB-type zinc finger domain-containing protein [Aliiroseovarius sediminis]|uniref:TFIIB-type zinc finger domain-containing protein n=1 Tax=Aliiroseovarius sediminis TaxID=2925839 RepID=UPI001F5A7E34|nr:TFIIB-type zinc finger domain-containing protein [Aliiroseovarius sediminis]MCI2394229.1 TFIIB-type zinc finger domain-containing protein [Aliiroseovarius sediminis]
MAFPREDAQAVLEEHRFPCDKCGADLRFDPERNLLTCDHCGNQQPIDDQITTAPVIRELDLQSALAQHLPDTEVEVARVVTCPNCAALIEFDGDTHADECPFCATPVVTDTGTHRRYKPKGVAPFEIRERDAHKAMTDWLGRLWFAPNGLRAYARKGRKMTGVYVPYWTFDANTRTSYHGQRGTVHESVRTVTVNGERRQKRTQHVKWQAVTGRVARLFDDVLVLASRGLPKAYTDALEPWDLSRLEPYRPEYLAGFQAEGYTVDLEQGFSEARDYMNRIIQRDVKFDIGGDRQRVTSMDTKLSDVTFKHILLPVWLAAYKYRGKTYRFVVNGQNGKVQGERPYSAWKIAFAVVLGLIAAAIIGYLSAQSQ